MYCIKFGETVSVPGCGGAMNRVSGANVAYDAADRIAPIKTCPPPHRFVGTELAFAFN